jgi:hypothetical protein
MRRRHVMEPLSRAAASPDGCRVIAFDRPPFGLTERPLRWEGGEEANPYTAAVMRDQIVSFSPCDTPTLTAACACKCSLS